MLAVRSAYGWPTFDGGDLLTTKAQDAILIVSLLAAPLFFLVGIGAFDYWFYWAAGKPDAARGPLEPRRPHAGATTSRSTPTTR